MRKTIQLWDLPTRIFHWTLVLSVAGAFISGQVGGNWMEVHGKLGLLIVGLLTFRLVWGLFGSTYARFSNFLPTPAKISAYLKGQWQEPGHNPLGALSVFGLLGILSLQVASGLVANDDIAFTGPLQALISKDLSDQITGLHHLVSKIILLLVVLHVGAIIFYVRVKGENLVKPMITGNKEVTHGESAQGGGWLALALSLAFAGLCVLGASGAFLPPPAPVPAPTNAPGW